MPKPLLCDPALLTRDLSGRRYVVTGANAGIGLVTAKQLALQGAHVVLACRRVAEAEARISEIVAEHPNAKLEARELDLGSLASVRRFAERVNADFDRLDGLVNNAGVMNTPKQTTADGFEMQIGVNHLHHARSSRRQVGALPSRGRSLALARRSDRSNDRSTRARTQRLDRRQRRRRARRGALAALRSRRGPARPHLPAGGSA